MLQAYPTKNGTGVSIFGDYGDLTSLYETVHHIANTLNENNKKQQGQHQLLMNFAYEIRKAYSGQRLVDNVQFDGDTQKISYFGFQVVWTDIIIFINTLIHNAGNIQTNKLHQANLHLLEYIIENALFAYDAEGANSIKNYLTQRVNISNEYVFLLYQSLHIKFVTEKSGKPRFRKIPDFITEHFSENTEGYKKIIRALEEYAKAEKCDIIELEFVDFPEIKW